ncbi:MAG: hypothetical protein LUG85_06565 [Clostridiales bacterium]|nr:hypothetical protein [Clostridiales bacterium]
MPYDSVRQLIYIFVRASVHYALFGNEEYLNAQIDFIVNAIRQIWTQCSGSQRPADATKPANQNQKI